MAVTIRQIADKAGVSPATVSLVLRRRPGIGTETRERVLATAASLGYRQRPPAQAGRRTVCFLRIAKHGHVVNPSHNLFIADYIDGMEAEARLAGLNLEIKSQGGFDPALVLASLDPGAIAGAIVLGTELDEADFLALSPSPLPLVFIDSYNSALGFDFVDMDNVSSVLAAILYLRDSGHRRIGLVRSQIETRNFREREEGFHESLARLGLPFDRRDSFSIDSTYEKGRDDMARLLEGGRDMPSALFCVNDIVAYACASALAAAGIPVPARVSLVGFDDLPSNSYMSPPLTSIGVSKKRIGEYAMRLMASRLEEPERPSEKILVGGALVVRESVRILTGTDGSESI